MTTFSNNRAFFYIDGIPTRGAWVDLDLVNDTDEVLKALQDAGLLLLNNEDGDVHYGGDLLVSAIEGALAAQFLSRHDCFDMDGWCDARDNCDEQYDAAAAYIGHYGSWNRQQFEDSYIGKHDSEVSYVQDEDNDVLRDMPEHLKAYFDWESYARDVFTNDMTFVNGYVFINN